MRVLLKSTMFPALAFCLASSVQANEKAKIFGALPSVTDISLSPDGSKVAFVSPGPGTTTDLYTIDLKIGGTPTRITSSSGDPESSSGDPESMRNWAG